MARVLILRERQAAAQTAALAVARGHVPIILPLEAYRRLDLLAGLAGAAPASPDGRSSDRATQAGAGDPMAAFAGFLLTSPRAVPALAASGADRDRPVFAVGEKTAEAARGAGFRRVVAGSNDAAQLARAVADAGFATGARLLYAAGRTRTGGLEAALAPQGIELSVAEAYATERLSVDREAIVAALAGRLADAVLVLSAGQAAAFSQVFRAQGDLFVPPPIPLALSARIADALTPELRSRTRISSKPSIEQLFERLS